MGSVLLTAVFIALQFATGLANPDSKRLYDDLLSNYNRLIRPVGNNSDRLTVKMGLRLSQLIDVVSTAGRRTQRLSHTILGGVRFLPFFLPACFLFCFFFLLGLCYILRERKHQKGTKQFIPSLRHTLEREKWASAPLLCHPASKYRSRTPWNMLVSSDSSSLVKFSFAMNWISAILLKPVCLKPRASL